MPQSPVAPEQGYKKRQNDYSAHSDCEVHRRDAGKIRHVKSIEIFLWLETER
jgi:hypothetical protein